MVLFFRNSKRATTIIGKSLLPADFVYDIAVPGLNKSPTISGDPLGKPVSYYVEVEHKKRLFVAAKRVQQINSSGW